MGKIRIELKDKPNLPQCEFLCDKGLHEKLNKYELTSYMNCHSTNLFIGRPKSGKTSLIYSLFKSPKLFKKCYHNVYIFQPSSSRMSMSDQLFNSLPDDQIFEDLNVDNLSFVMDRLKTAESYENSCIIFDDMTAYLKDPENLKLLKELIYNRRHLHCSIFFLVQTWYSVPKDIRKLFSNVFIFKVAKTELTAIFDEVIEQKKEDILEISKIVFDKPYQYLFLNTDSQKMYKCFDRIILDEE